MTRESTAADDLVQETLLRAYERAVTFREGASLRAWLFSILHNQFLSGVRRQAVEQRHGQMIAATLVESPPDQEWVTRLREVAERFDALSDNHRAVLHMVAVEGMTYQEVAAALGWPIGTVMSRLSRARALLRDWQEREPGEIRLIGGARAG